MGRKGKLPGPRLRDLQQAGLIRTGEPPSRPRTGLGQDTISLMVAKRAVKDMERELSALNLRKLALGEAISAQTIGGPDMVVHAAEKYLAFLMGKPTKRGK